MERAEPRVLVISHNPFSQDGNMGRALAGLFSGWDPERLAQLYFHREMVGSPLAGRSYRFTDVDALFSILLPQRTGLAFGGQAGGGEKDGTGHFHRLYQIGHSSRTPLVALTRDALWGLSRWDNRALRDWVEEFGPEVIFYAPGDHTFSYRIACTIAERYHLPVVAVCYDDFYLQYRHSLLGSAQHALLMRWAHRTIDGSSCLLTICRPMSEVYGSVFGVPCREVYTPAHHWAGQREVTGQVAYFGNLGLGRWRQLLEIGRALKRLALPGLPQALDVYSWEKDEAGAMTAENGICFHGGVSSQEACRKMAGCLLLVHTESFHPQAAARVKYSVSTKIPDYLASGVCLLAYGPEEVASMRYLQENGAAQVVTSASCLEASIKEILENSGLRQEIARRGQLLARKNHGPAANAGLMREVLTEAVQKGRKIK